jgi:cytochrome c oxidase assembly protein subunit 15
VTTSASYSPWLHRFAVLTAGCTLLLIWIGGLVTSHGVGMAVPDWPTTYGYNMFFFPFSKWVGGIFYEHSHRLIAALVGLLTSILAAWIWARETTGKVRWRGLITIIVLVAALGHRGSQEAIGGVDALPLHFRMLVIGMPLLVVFGVIQCIQQRGALRWLAMTAYFAVILQGVLGGLRVVQMKDALGIFHATLAQLFFALLCSIALFTSRWWQSGPKSSIYGVQRLRYVVALVTGLILVQLILGASMRHQHAGLAIPDFPLAHGALWPATDADSIARYNAGRHEVAAQNPVTAAQVVLQMVHRLIAVGILFAVAWTSGKVLRRVGWGSVAGKLAGLWMVLIAAQIVLGATVIWTGKAADIATAHVAVGALSLISGTLLALSLSRSSAQEDPVSAGGFDSARDGAAVQGRLSNARA